jgi:hypothetical protein
MFRPSWPSSGVSNKGFCSFCNAVVRISLWFWAWSFFMVFYAGFLCAWLSSVQEHWLRYETYMTADIKMIVFWDVTWCSLAIRYRYFGGTSYFFLVPCILLGQSQDSSVSLIMGYGLGGRISVPGGGKRFFSTSQRADGHWDPPSLMSVSGYGGLFLWG